MFAILSLLVFAVSIALVLINTEIFKSITLTGKPQSKPINALHKIVGILIAIAVPMLTYHKISLRLSSISPSKLFPMNWANYITWFSLFNAGVLLVVFLVWFFVYGKKQVKGVEAYGLSVGSKETGSAWKKILLSFVFGVVVIFSVYFIVNLCYNIFKIDFYYWLFGIMPITMKRFSHILPYLLSFIVVFGVLNVIGYTLFGNSTENKGKWAVFGQYALNWLIGVGGLALLLAIYSIVLKVTNYPPFFYAYPPFVNGNPNSLVFSMKLIAMVPSFTFASML